MRGIPYSLYELRQASKQPMDLYHRDLMEWAASRIEELEARDKPVAAESVPSICTRENWPEWLPPHRA